jgi:hypothetical protein
MEALWPDESREVVSRRLSVALATLRAVLDPDKRHPPDRFVVGDRDAVRLDLANLPVDVEQFLAAAAGALASYGHHEAREARAELAQAESLYTGDFLDEDQYEDWATPLRDEARTTYVSVVRALAALADASGHLDDALRYHRRVLERDAWGRRGPSRPGEPARAGGLPRGGEALLPRVRLADGRDPGAGGAVPILLSWTLTPLERPSARSSHRRPPVRA